MFKAHDTLGRHFNHKDKLKKLLSQKSSISLIAWTARNFMLVNRLDMCVKVKRNTWATKTQVFTNTLEYVIESIGISWKFSNSHGKLNSVY